MFSEMDAAARQPRAEGGLAQLPRPLRADAGVRLRAVAERRRPQRRAAARHRRRRGVPAPDRRRPDALHARGERARPRARPLPRPRHRLPGDRRRRPALDRRRPPQERDPGRGVDPLGHRRRDRARVLGRARHAARPAALRVRDLARAADDRPADDAADGRLRHPRRARCATSSPSARTRRARSRPTPATSPTWPAPRPGRAGRRSLSGGRTYSLEEAEQAKLVQVVGYGTATTIVAMAGADVRLSLPAGTTAKVRDLTEKGASKPRSLRPVRRERRRGRDRRLRRGDRGRQGAQAGQGRHARPAHDRARQAPRRRQAAADAEGARRLEGRGDLRDGRRQAQHLPQAAGHARPSGWPSSATAPWTCGGTRRPRGRRRAAGAERPPSPAARAAR